MSSISTLKLEDSAFGLEKSIKTLSRDITKLDLSGNSLGFEDVEETIQTLKIIPAWVTALSLANNLLRYSYNLIKLLSAIPRTVTTLDLSYNFLYELQTSDLGNVLAAIPEGVTKLSLSGESLGPKGTELAKVFVRLPPNIVVLDLRLTKLDKMSLESLIELKNSLPYLRKIYLSYDEVSNLSTAQRAALFDIFPNVAPKDIIFVRGNTALDDCNLEGANLLRKLEVKSNVPSLANQCAFFVKHSPVITDLSSLPLELQAKVNAST